VPRTDCIDIEKNCLGNKGVLQQTPNVVAIGHLIAIGPKARI
jgi:hypothetical protein